MSQTFRESIRIAPSHAASCAKTDRLSPDTYAYYQFNGVLQDALHFTKENQLMSSEHWTRFVNQFRTDADARSRGWRGEYWGKMMRGACFVCATTRDAELEAVLCQTVEDMMSAADADGRISAYSYETEYDGWDLWCRKYVMLGMEYYWEICTDEELRARIVTSVRRQADVIIDHIGPEEEGKKPVTKATRNWRGLNSVSILEPMVRLYHLTGEKRYFDFATYLVSTGAIDGENLFELAYADQLYPYQYPVTKAYEMMSCFEGLLEYGRLTGEQKHLDTVIRFAHRVMESDVTVIGSCGCTHELFDHSTYRQTCTDYQGIMQETCVTVTWMKFCMQLLTLTGDPIFADQIEQSLYNAYLGAFNTEHKIPGGLPLEKYPELQLEALPFDSYSPLVPDTRGRRIGGLQVMADMTYYGCCACIASAGIGMLSRVALQRGEEALYLNLYGAGTIETAAPDGTPLSIRIDTDYPADGTVRLTLNTKTERDFTFCLRIPAWSEQNTVTVEGGCTAEGAEKGYMPIRIPAGVSEHQIVLELDMRVKCIHPIGVGFGKDELHINVDWANNCIIPSEYIEDPKSRYHIALRRGPLMLGGDNRLGYSVDDPVQIAEMADGTAKATVIPTEQVPYPCMIALAVEKTDGTRMLLTDYASVGKTWDETSRCAVWLPTPEDEQK